MGAIHLLPEVLRNQIAAGEVVERPASALKELVENSADAGARTILVEIENGGKDLIRVSDDGEGMTPEDAKRAFLRHATSKISSLRDLQAVATFGFRGEALAAIASVSRVELTTTPAGAAEGYRVIIEGGKEITAEPAAPAPGTRVDVKNLFYNTPARKKFLKATATETWHCTEALTQRALVDLRRSITMRNGARTVLDVSPCDGYGDRIRRIFGEELFRNLVALEPTAGEGWNVSGFISRRDFRSNRRVQYLFVNDRPVRSPVIQHTIASVFDRIAPGAGFPVYVLYLTLDPSRVDVNVHPAKREVRFIEPATVQRHLEAALKPTILGFSGVHSPPGRPEMHPPVPTRPPTEETRWAPWESGENTEHPGPTAPALVFAGEPEGGRAAPASAPPHIVAGRAFIAIPEGDGLTVIDFHAAHERILYERFLKKRFQTERLLLPRKCSLDPRAYAAVLDGRAILAEFGIIVDDFGGNTVVVREVPAELAGADLEGFFAEFEEVLRTGRNAAPEDFRRTVAARLACRDAVKAGYTLHSLEVARLLEELNDTDDPTSCPHGRPTRIHLADGDLRRLFRRT